MDRDLWLMTVHGRRLLAFGPERLKAITAEQIESMERVLTLLDIQKPLLDAQADREREMREFEAQERRKVEMHRRLAVLMPALIKGITGSGT